MKVLALDTATEACSVALLTDADLVGVFREVGRGHAEQILDMVDAVLSEAGMVLGMLDGIDARMGEVYWGCYATDPERGLTARGAAAVGAAESVNVPLVGPFQGIGRGFAAYPVLQALAGLTLPAGACD